MCYYFHPRCQTNTFFDKNILWIICVKYDALTDKRSFGAGITGILLAAIYAASQSTLSTGLNSVATSWTLDIQSKISSKELSFEKQTKIAQYISLVYFQIFGQQRMQQNGFSHIRNYILIHSSF